MEIGERIKLIRELRGFTQAYVCKIIGWNKTALSRIELGKIIPRRDTIEKIAKALDIEYETLMGITEEIAKSIKKIKKNEFDLIIDLSDKMIFYFGRLEKNIDKKRIIDIINEINYHSLSLKGLSIKEIVKKLNIHEEVYEKINKNEIGILTFRELLNSLNENNLSIFDMIEPFKEESDLPVVQFIIRELESFLNNLYIRPKYNNFIPIHFKSFDEIISMYHPDKAILELITDKKNIELMKINIDEVLWLIRIPVMPGMEFSKQDYIDMLYLYRKAHQKKQEGDNVKSD